MKNLKEQLDSKELNSLNKEGFEAINNNLPTGFPKFQHNTESFGKSVKVAIGNMWNMCLKNPSNARAEAALASMLKVVVENWK